MAGIAWFGEINLATEITERKEFFLKVSVFSPSTCVSLTPSRQGQVRGKCVAKQLTIERNHFHA